MKKSMSVNNKNNKLKFVNNSTKYHEFIRGLRNDKRVKHNLIQQEHITERQQRRYMKKHGRKYCICLCDGKPAGYIGVIDDDIRIVVHPDFQNKGIGLFLVRNIMKKHRKLQAKIKVENRASIRLFEKAGFKLKYHIFEYGR